MESAELDDDSYDPTDKVPTWDGLDTVEPPALVSTVVPTVRSSLPSVHQTQPLPVVVPRRIAHGTIAPPINVPALRAPEPDIDIDIGDEWDELDLAIERVYGEELDRAPDHDQLLDKLLGVYAQTQHGEKAVAAVHKLVELETDSFRKGVYLHAAATVCRESSRSEALTYYGRALDCFFAEIDQLDEQQLLRALASFEAIDMLLASEQDWHALAQAYRDMIERLASCSAPRFERLRVGLYDGLGEIYRSRLEQHDDATAAFEAAHQLDPNGEVRPDRAEILAALCLAAGPDQADKAIEQHRAILQREPFRYDSYKTLAHLYRSTGQHDKCWCVCSTLAFLNKAGPSELAFYEHHKPRGLVKAQTALSADSWAKLSHPDENRHVSAMLSACWEAVAAMHAHPHKSFGLRREDRRQLDSDPLLFSKLCLYVAKALNVRLPEIYLMDDDKAVDIQLANAFDGTLCPSFAVRPQLLQGKNEREIAFLLARRLAFMRPAYYLRMLLPSYVELEQVVLATIVMVQPDFPVAPDMVATVQQSVKRMRKRIPPYVLEQLATVVEPVARSMPAIELARWAAAVDAVSHRVGLVMCGDLEAAARAIATEPFVEGGPSAKDKTRQLVLFSISEELFAVRAQLGIALAA
jgi:golgin subfamily B member 1